MALAIEVAAAKTNKYASRDSGDTVELVERPGGGFSVVLVDGQGSGAAAKSLSLMVTSKAVALLKEGVRDGAVARAVHDNLFAFRHGRVSATLDILSVDLKTRTVIATKNGETPTLVRLGGQWRLHPSTATPIGLYHFTRPAVMQLPAEAGLRVVLVTDGVAAAGRGGGGGGFSLEEFLPAAHTAAMSGRELADLVLLEAIARDRGRPGDDMTVVVLGLDEHEEDPLIRRLNALVPLP